MIHLSADGAIAGSLGGPGAGPGELLQPVALSRDPSENPSVFDRSKGGFVGWTRAQGVPLPEVRVGSLVFGPDAALLPEGLVYRSLHPAGGGIVHYGLSCSAGGDVRVIVRGPPIESRSADYPSCGATAIMSPEVFAPSLPWRVMDGRIAVSDSYEYQVRIFQSGSERLRIVRDAPVRPGMVDRVERALGGPARAKGLTGPESQPGAGPRPSRP